MKNHALHSSLAELVIALGLSAATFASAHAVVIGGIDFPHGPSSFADAVTSFNPAIAGGNPTIPHLGPANALGIPSGNTSSCINQASCAYVSLGDGGSITLEFVDNRLTASGNSNSDLWIFEVGAVEDTFVEVSKNGSTFFPVGKVFGSTSGVDLDSFGFTPADLFRFVRLTDDSNEGEQSPSGITVGADIDAVGAIFSSPVPEPTTFAMFFLGVIGFAGYISSSIIKRDQ